MKVFASQNELLDWMKENPDIDYIAEAISPLHAINVDAAISKLMSENKVKKGLILIASLQREGYFISKQNFFHTEEDGVTFIKLLPENNSARKQVSNMVAQFFNCCARNTEKNPFYIIKPWLPAYQYMVLAKKAFPDRIPVAISIDEGVGSYLQTNRYIVHTKTGDGKTWKHRAKRLANYANMCIKRQLFVWMLKRHHRYLDWNLLNKVDGQWEVNEDIRPFWGITFEQISRRLTIKSEKYENHILFASQPYAECSDINSEMEIQMLSEMCDSIGNAFQIIHKPHPREMHLERYEALGLLDDFENQGFPLECIISVAKPKAIISYTSSILVYAKAIWDIPVISIINLLDIDQVNDTTKEGFERFQSVFGKLIFFPQSMDELERYLSKL